MKTMSIMNGILTAAAEIPKQSRQFIGEILD
jgi:hypothetical protein